MDVGYVTCSASVCSRHVGVRNDGLGGRQGRAVKNSGVGACSVRAVFGFLRRVGGAAEGKGDRAVCEWGAGWLGERWGWYVVVCICSEGLGSWGAGC